MDHAKLAGLVEVAPYYHQLVSYAQLVITVTEKYIYAIPGDHFFLDVFDAGKTFLDGSIAKETVVTKKIVERQGNKALTGGIPYQGIGIPIIESGEMVGSMCLFYPTEHKEALQQASTELVSVVSAAREALLRMEKASNHLNQGSQRLLTNSAELETSSQEIFAMTEMIQEVSAQTNLLGLNSAIEAARAGEYGRGFSIVSDEIRKLSVKTKVATTDIRTANQIVSNNIQSLKQQVDQLAFSVSEEGEGIVSTSEALTQIMKISEILHALAQVIVH